MIHAKGTFEVKLTPQKPDNEVAESANLARMSIDKQFVGDLQATSKGEMLSAMTEVKGSAGYVAMERGSGTLRSASSLNERLFRYCAVAISVIAPHAQPHGLPEPLSRCGHGCDVWPSPRKPVTWTGLCSPHSHGFVSSSAVSGHFGLSLAMKAVTVFTMISAASRAACAFICVACRSSDACCNEVFRSTGALITHLPARCGPIA